MSRQELTLLELPPMEEEPQGDESALVAAAQAESSAFAPLYRRYARPIYRFCYRHLGSHEAAEDATSQTFVKALAGIGRYRPERGAFRSWLFTIADRVCIDLYRTRRQDADLETVIDMANSGHGPEEMAIAAEAHRSVQEMLEQLTPDQQRVVTLRLAGLTGPEIAVVLGRKREAVKGLQFRAYARLRQLLSDEEGPR